MTRFAVAPHDAWKVEFDTRRKPRWRPKYVMRLAESPDVAHVIDLDLRSAWTGVEGIRALAGSPYLGGLRRLDLRSTRLDDEAATVLATGPGLAGLVYLDLRHNPITEAASGALRAKFGAAVRLDDSTC
jgi:hypothetical protein